MNFRRLLLPLQLIIIAITVVSVSAANKRDMLVKVYFENKGQWFQLLKMGLDIAHVSDRYIEIVTDSAELKLLQEDDRLTEVVQPSLSRFYRSRISDKEALDMGGYRTLSEIYAYLDAIRAEHPEIVSAKQHIGYTYEGRDTWAIKISDNPDVDEDEPEVLYYAAQHAREVITPAVLIYFMDYLIDNYAVLSEVQELVDSRELYFILVVNPDGYYHNQVIAPEGGGMWRKNRHPFGADTGVDLNRNAGYMWGYDDFGSSPDPQSTTYRGEAPFSEPESQNLRDFTESREFIITVNYHSYSNLIIWPWGYDYLLTPDNDIFVHMGDSISAWNNYAPSPIWGLYPVNGGSCDWEYGEQTTKNKNLAISLEVGGSSDYFWPPPSRIAPLVEENLQPNLFVARIAGSINTFYPPGMPVVFAPSRADSAEYTVSWYHQDTLNPAVVFELIEYEQALLVTDSGNSLDFWDDNGFSVSGTRSHSAPYSFYSGTGNAIQNHMQSIIPLEVEDGDTLRFWTYYNLESGLDYAYVEVSTDGQEFVPIPGNISDPRDPYGLNRGYGITGSSHGWIEGIFDLSAFDEQQILIRFSYYTDPSDTYEGFYVDDISPHMAFGQETVIGSNITDTFYTFYDEPVGGHYYRVRARDAQQQWGDYSLTVYTDVAGFMGGDIDLDGISSSVADLTLFDLYLLQGTDAFSVDLEAQTAQTDIDCDGQVLTVPDMELLNQVVLGLSEPCYGGSFFLAPPPDGPADEKALGPSSQALMSVSAEELSFAVVLQNMSPESEDTSRIDIVLTEGNADILGFQFHVEYDTSGFELVDIQIGGNFSAWDYFSHNQVISGNEAWLKMVGVAWTTGDPIAAEDIDPQPAPKSLAKMTFAFKVPADTLSRDVRFIWEKCGDNTIAVGGYADTAQGSPLVLDVLALSRTIYSANLYDITGGHQLYGGKAGHCDNGLLGATPVSAVDFTSGRIDYVPGCCVGLTGNVDCGPEGEVDIGDVTRLIAHLFITLEDLCCEAQANVDGGPPETIDIGDLTALISSLFISLDPTAACP